MRAKSRGVRKREHETNRKFKKPYPLPFFLLDSRPRIDREETRERDSKSSIAVCL